MGEKRKQDVYGVDELAAAAGLFGASAMVVRAALRHAGQEQYTEKEAMKIVETFRQKEVK